MSTSAPTGTVASSSLPAASFSSVPTAGSTGPASLADGAPAVPVARLAALLNLRVAGLLFVSSIAALIIGAAGTPNPGEWRILSGLLYVVPVDVLTLGVLAWAMAKERSSLGRLLGRFRALDTVWGLLIAVLLTVALLAGTFVGNLLVYGGAPPQGAWDPAFRTPLWVGVWSLVVAPLTVAFAEELLYRGYLQPRWEARIGFVPALLLVSAFFALQHVAFVLTMPGAIPAKLLGTFLGGVLLGLLYRRFGRLWPLVIGHWIADVVGLGLVPFLAALGS